MNATIKVKITVFSIIFPILFLMAGPLSAADFNGITFGNSTFVVVGDGGAVATSADATTWTLRASGITTDLYGVAYGNNTFVAAGSYGKILTSPDAVTWTVRASGITTDLYCVTYGNNTFIAAGSNGKILTSADAVTWTVQSAYGFSDDFYGITYGGGAFVAVGFNEAIYTSTDTLSWKIQNSGAYKLFSAAYFNNTFFAMGESGTFLTSSDGQWWTRAAKFTLAGLYGMAYGSNKFVLSGSSGTIATSTDTATWTASQPEPFLGLYGITYGNGAFAAAAGNASVLSSSDAVTWTKSAIEIPVQQHELSLVFSGTGSGAVTSSPEGISCGTACSATFDSGTEVVLTAVADSGSQFSGWSGDCSGTGTCTLTVNENKSVTASFSLITSSCTYKYSPSSTTRKFNYKAGTGSVRVAAIGTGCTWTATSNDEWIGIKSGGSGSGKKGTVTFSVQANTSSSERNGTLTIAGQTFTVTQAGAPCKYTTSPAAYSPLIPSLGGTGTINVTATPSDCSWSAAVDAVKYPWITIDSGSTGTGSGSVGYSVAAKTTKKARTGKINIVGSDSKVKKTFTVRQAK